MNHAAGAGAFAIAAVASLAIVSVARRAPPERPVLLSTFEAPSRLAEAGGKADRLPLFTVPEPPLEAPKPPELEDDNVSNRRAIDDVRGIHGAASSDLPSRHARDQRNPERAADPICGARGRTYYRRENGWQYWRCNR